MSPLSYSACLYHLDEAFCRLDDVIASERSLWLRILGFRLASYFALVADPATRRSKPVVSSSLQKFFTLELDSMCEKVSECYRDFAVGLGGGDALETRVECYERTFSDIRRECVL